MSEAAIGKSFPDRLTIFYLLSKDNKKSFAH